MKNKFLLVSALGAVLFSLASCNDGGSKGSDKDTNNSEPHGQLLDETQKQSFFDGFKEKYGTEMTEEKYKLFFEGAKTGKVTSTLTDKYKEKPTDEYEIYTRTDTVEYILDEDYIYAEADEKFDADTLKTKVFYAKDGNDLYSFTERGDEKYRRNAYGIIHESLIEQLSRISRPGYTDAFMPLENPDDFTEENELKVYKETNTYFMTFKLSNQNRRSDMKFKIRYNQNYLPIYFNLNLEQQGGTPEGPYLAEVLSTELKFEFTSVTKRSFDKTTYPEQEVN